jgi:hypothetical protein
MMNLNMMGSVDLSVMDIAVRLLAAGIMGFLIAVVYSVTSDKITYSSTLRISLCLISVVICAVMVAINSNIALSLGLVGSLSVIRFRTVIKDPLEMIFLFWAIATGVATGAGVVKVAVLLFFFISIFFVVYQSHSIIFPSSRSFRKATFAVTIVHNESFEKISKILKENTDSFELLSEFTLLDNNERRTSFEVSPLEGDAILAKLSDGLNGSKNIKQVNFVKNNDS